MKRRFLSPVPRTGRLGVAGWLCCCMLALSGCGGGSDDGSSAPVDGGGGGQPPPVVSKGSISLLAGSIGGAGNLDGTGAAARFASPAGLALDPAGDLYVADLGNQRVRKVTRAGEVSTFAGSGQRGYADGQGRSATFCYPRDVAVDPAGNVFVATDTAVRRITPDAVVTTVAGVGSARCGVYDASTDVRRPPESPTAVAVDAFGIAYIADSYAGAVYTLTPAGALTRIAGSDDRNAPRAPGLGYPNGIAVDAMRNVYVADRDGISRITRAGQLTTWVPGSPAHGYPAAIAADAAGNLYLADSQHHVVRKVTALGGISMLAGVPDEPGSIDGPHGSARLDSPQGIALAADGTLFVAENANTIRRIDPSSGSVSTLAGLATPRAPNFGPYQAVDRAGNAYVAVQVATYPNQDYAIRRIAPDGTGATLLAGGLNNPKGIAVNESSGNVYVVDWSREQPPCRVCGWAGVVYRITPHGEMTPLAGSLTPRDSASVVDGIGSTAGILSSQGLAIDDSGNLYLA